MTEPLTADTITDEQIRALRDSGALTPGEMWECSIVLDQQRMKQRMNKTKERIRQARARLAAILNAREVVSE